MKLKAAITDGAPDELFVAFGAAWFAEAFIDRIATKLLGAKRAMSRPAEYYVQFPDRTIAVANCEIGIEVRLTGVSRAGRSPEVFYKMLEELQRLVRETAKQVLPSNVKAQIFVVVMLDGDIEVQPGSGRYSSVLESEAVWV